MNKLKSFFTTCSTYWPLVISFIDLLIGGLLLVILGYSTITHTPIMEIESFDSQWWILFLVLLTWQNTKK